MKTTLSFLVALVATSLFAVAGVSTGEPAPDFKLKDIQGTEHSLSEFKGKYVVLEWVNYGCPFVRKHYDSGNMQKLQGELTAQGAVWLSICSSTQGKQGNMTPEAWQKAVTEKAVKSTAILLDSDGTVGKLYAAKTTPHVYLINPEGKLVYQGAIDSVASADQADIAKATNYIRAAFDEAKAGKPVTQPETKPYGCSVKY